MFLTQKQIELIRVISEKNPDGSLIDLDQITERAAHKPSKQSLQFSIRALLKHGLITKEGSENRRDRRRTLIAMTPLGEHFASANRTSAASAIVELDESLLE